MLIRIVFGFSEHVVRIIKFGGTYKLVNLIYNGREKKYICIVRKLTTGYLVILHMREE